MSITRSPSQHNVLIFPAHLPNIYFLISLNSYADSIKASERGIMTLKYLRNMYIIHERSGKAR